MFPHERDFLISRIKCGYLRIKYKNNTLKFKLNRDVLYEANEIFCETYEKCVNLNFPDDDKLYDFLVGRGIWNESEEERLVKKIPEYIENVKVEMYKTWGKPSDIERMRLYLRRAEQELYKIFDIRHQLDYLSCIGMATFARWQFLVENCTTHIDNSSVDWTKTKNFEILSLINNSNISEQQIRELSRNEPWSLIWIQGKRLRNIFEGPISDYTDEQKRLIYWSTIYDNVMDREDPPPEGIYDDDDCFDGWLITNNKRAAKNKKIEEFEKRLGKNKNAQELFIPVQCLNSEGVESEQDRFSAEDIFDMNDSYTHSVINSRLQCVQTRGQVDFKDLPDVRRELDMQINRMETQR